MNDPYIMAARFFVCVTAVLVTYLVACLLAALFSPRTPPADAFEPEHLEDES